jgi:hypothetical protein
VTSKKLYQEALDIQDGSNLGGLVHRFNEVVSELQEEMHRSGYSTSWVNRHPIITLWLDKLCDLNCTYGDHQLVSQAYHQCKDAAEVSG